MSAGCRIRIIIQVEARLYYFLGGLGVARCLLFRRVVCHFGWAAVRVGLLDVGRVGAWSAMPASRAAAGSDKRLSR